MTAKCVSRAVSSQAGMRALAYSSPEGWAVVAAPPWPRPYAMRHSREGCEVQTSAVSVVMMSVLRRRASAPGVSWHGVHVV